MLPSPLPLRGHAVLCLQGFRGRGYSPAFVARMTEVASSLAADPARLVRLLDGPDLLCEACPHLREGCTLRGPGHEESVRAQDREVLARLGLARGDVLPWEEVRARIGRAIGGRDLADICTTCPWLSLGWCAEGIDALAPPGGSRGA